MYRIFPLITLLFTLQFCFAQSLVITNVSIIDVNTGRLLPGQTLVLTGDRITAVGATSEIKIPAGSTMVETY